MKKLAFFIGIIFIFSSCLNNDDVENYGYDFVAIDEAKTPINFTFGEVDTITVKYTLPNSCYSFRSIYYEYQDTARVVAINAFVDLSNSICNPGTAQQEYKIPVSATQKEDYIFKFYKGKDSIGKNIFEEIVVPVN